MTFLPLLTIALSYFISVQAGLVPACIPFVEGCTSISRAAREGNAIFVFRPGMMITAVFLVWYWYLAQLWLFQLNHRRDKTTRLMFWLGTLGAIFLVLYADFLGSEGSFYRLMRRYGITLFFACTLLAQFIQLRQQLRLIKSRRSTSLIKKIVAAQYVICLIILLIGLTSVILKMLQLNSDQSENILEWNVSFFIMLFFLGSYFVWKESHFQLQPIVRD
jgi:hypothetical protein